MSELKTAYNFKGKDIVLYEKIDNEQDLKCTNEIVIKETFIENVYQVHPNHYNDTGVVVDLGANGGAFGIMSILMGAKKVYAFEPEPTNYKYLLRNIEENGMKDKIIPFNMAVIGDEKEVEITANCRHASFITQNRKWDPTGNTLVKVQGITLKKVFDEIVKGSCDVLKIDVECSEYDIFRTIDEETLKKSKYITAEFHTYGAAEYGMMMAQLSLTHNVHTFGKWSLGGQFYATRY